MKSLSLYLLGVALVATMAFAFIRTLPVAIDKLTQHQTTQRPTYDNAQY